MGRMQCCSSAIIACEVLYESVLPMKNILIIGAGYLQDFVILKAKELGYYTLAIDGSPDAIGLCHADKSAVINIVDPIACYEYAKNEDIDGVLTVATDYAIISTSYVAEKLNLPGLNYETAKIIKNKYEIRKRLMAMYVDDINQAYEIDFDTDLNSLSITYPVIVKPCDGSGSRSTELVDCLDKLKSACINAISDSKIGKAIVETFVYGNEYGAESLVVNGDIHVLGIMKKWMTDPPYYAELGHQIPSELPPDIELKAIKCVEKAIRALNINHGAVNMDLIINAYGDVHIIDVGARMGGNMIGPCIIPIGTGNKYLENLIRTAVGDSPDWNRNTPRQVATRLLAFKGGIVRQLPDFTSLEQTYDVKIYHHMKEGDVINEYHTNLDGCGYIIAHDKETADIVFSEIEKYVN